MPWPAGDQRLPSQWKCLFNHICMKLNQELDLRNQVKTLNQTEQMRHNYFYLCWYSEREYPK